MTEHKSDALAKDRAKTGERYYGDELRRLLEAPPHKFAWGRVAVFAIPLAMLSGLVVAAFSHGPVRLSAAMVVLLLAAIIPLVARLTK